MKICIYGAGAAGCTIGAKLKTSSNADVTLIGRGEHLRAIQKNGLKLIGRDSEEIIPISTTDDPASLKPQDYIIIATKAYNISEIAESLQPLLHENTAIIPACNGVPWWFLYNLRSSPLKNGHIECLDNDKTIEINIPTKRIIGGLFYMAATITSPGVVTNLEGPKFIIGEPDGKTTERVSELGNILLNAGFKNPITDNIRGSIWIKLCWNIAFNPLSVIYNMPSGELAKNEETKKIAEEIMNEMQEVGNELGLKFNLDIERHIKIADDAGSHKPSMLQDFENGKPLEIDAIIGSVCEIVGKLEIKTPTIENIYKKLKERATP